MARIVIAQRTAEGRGGVQTWSETVRTTLVSKGHDVAMWDRVDLPRDPSVFDIGVISHWNAMGPTVAPVCKKFVSISHGIIPEEEPGLNPAFTSEGVRAHWCDLEDSPIIRQPIDLDYWVPPTGSNLRKDNLVVRYSYYGGLEWLRPFFEEEFGMRYSHIRHADRNLARWYLQTATLVVSSGRGALEAMACGAPTIILDHRPYNGGPLMGGDDFLLQQLNNYSGRGGFEPDADMVGYSTRLALDSPRDEWRAFVEEHHDANAVVDQLLEAATALQPAASGSGLIGPKNITVTT